MTHKLNGANDQEKLKDLATKTYKEQAVWFLNAFWEEGLEKEAEKFWSYVAAIKKIDLAKGVDGNEVDEMQMHRFLEQFKETLTVREMRDNLRETGAIDKVPKNIPLIHYLIFRYKKNFKTLVNASQGNKEIDEAQKKLNEVQAAFKESEEKATAAKAALKEAQAREAEAKAGEANAKAREAEALKNEEEAHQREATAIAKAAEAKAAQEELQAAVKDLKEQEDAYNSKTDTLKKKTEEGSTVQQNKAKAELAQHLATPTLPLQRAKITQEAALKKADKASALASEARASAEKARAAAQASAKQASEARHEAEAQARQATAARDASARATAAAEAAVEECRAKVDEAEAYLNEVKSKPGSGKGAIWWMQRELHETKAYLPQKKGGYLKRENEDLPTE
jgi:chromosome segregation ATPase